MIDEQVSFDGCPCSKNDAHNEQCVVDNYPSGTNIFSEYKSIVEIGECKRQLDENEQKIDDQKNTKNLADKMIPFEMIQSKHRMLLVSYNQWSSPT